jgi:mannose-6-phosphate isomerase
VIGEELSRQFESITQEKGEDKEILSKVFTALMRADPKVVHEQLLLLTARLQDKTDKLSSTIKSIHGQFSGDVGVFCVFFLNLVTMTPGQGVFLAADEPHAYLKYV